MKTIGIVGSRRRDTREDYALCRKAFDALYEDGDIIVSGGCPLGGDKFAEEIAEELGLTIENGKLIIHYPDKAKLDPKLMKMNPRVAYAKINYARNTLIAEDADILLSVVAKNRKGGTEDTIAKALMMDKKIVFVNDNDIYGLEEALETDDDPLMNIGG